MEAEKIFLNNGTVWFLSTSSWTGKDKLKPEDIGVDPESILDIMELGSKKILPDDVRIKLNKPRSQITSLMDRLGKHFLHFKGAWWIPDKNFLLAKEGIDNIIAKQIQTVDWLIENKDEIRNEMIAEYPILVDVEWPSDQKIRKRFGINRTVCEVHGLSVQEGDVEELAQAKMMFQKELKQSYEEYKEQILMEAQMAIIEACKEISDKIKTSQKITEGNLKKPKRVIEEYLNVAEVFDIEGIKAEVNRLKQELENVTAEELRMSFNVAQDFSESLRNMTNEIGDLSGLSKDGTVKRIVKKAV